MADRDETGDGRRWSPWRLAGWGLAGLLLLLPLVAGAPWTLSDFVVMGLMLGTVGLGFELVVRKSGNRFYRLGAALAVVTAFLTVWVNLAVGMVASEGNPYNLLFVLVLAIALIGAILARFEAAGMARALVAAALVQAALGLGGIPADLRGGILSALFAVPWLLAAVLLWKAARQQVPARSTD